MHEMAIALQIIEIASDAIPTELAGTPVEAIDLKVGRFSAVVPESLRFCFDVASRDTAVAGARLRIEEVPVVCKCGDCGAEMTIDEPDFTCRQCDGGNLDFLTGRELDVVSLELAEPMNI